MRFFSRSGCGKFSAVISAGLSAAALLMISGCSVVQVNGTERTADDALCLVRPQIADPALHKLLKDLLTRKRFKVTELAPGTSPNVCRQTLVYRWGVEQYYVPALVKQYPVAFDFYESGVKVANASFDPTRNLISPHVKFVRSSRYWARSLRPCPSTCKTAVSPVLRDKFAVPFFTSHEAEALGGMTECIAMHPS